MRALCGLLMVLAVVLGGCKGSDDVLYADPHVFPPAPGMEVVWVATYQNQENVILDKDVAPQLGSTPPLLAGRDMWVRVGVDKAYSNNFSREILVLLQVQQGTKGAVNHVAYGRARRPSADDPDTTFNFRIPGDQITPGLKFEISVREPVLPPAFPEGTVGEGWIWTSPRLEVENTDRLELVIVPVTIQDGDKELKPDVSQAQQTLIKQIVNAQYPVSGVDIRIDEPMTWVGSFGSGGDWGELLDRVGDRRESAGITNGNTYYYGAITPEQPYGIAGLSNVAFSPSDDWARSSVGWGFSGPDSVDVLLHEVGHAHGRFHVACGGPDSPDPGYPHDPRYIGINAYDPVSGEFLGPEDAADIMSYCTPTWTSDYTFDALHERVLALRDFRAAKPRELRKGRVDGSLTGVASGTVRSVANPSGEPVLVQPYALDGRPLEPVEGWLYPYSHLPGGTVLFDDPVEAIERIELVEE